MVFIKKRAFATAVAVNAAYKIHKNKTVNLSKQQLVDCNVNNFGCNGGYIDRGIFDKNI
jgi:hypothetical protein